MQSPDTDFALDRQVALVTGASSGIGQACAIALGAAGARVVVNHPPGSQDGALETQRAIEAAGGTAIAVEADVRRQAQVDAMVAETVRTYGTLHILVNNAGIQRGAKFEEMTLEDWQTVIDINLTGQFLCARAAVREFLRRGMQPDVSSALGKIICMSSVHQTVPWAFECNYAASKGGVMLMMQSLAQEVSRHKIRVNAVAPGAIRTSINRQAWETEEAMQDLLALIPYDRIGETEDVARAVLWLASDLSDYVAGTTLYVDGGMTLYPAFRGAG